MPLNLRAPLTDPVTIMIPGEHMEGIRAAATTAANGYANGLGRSVQVQAGYGTCELNDPLCVEMQDDYGTFPGEDQGCAQYSR
jgi:hypothetical protein